MDSFIFALSLAAFSFLTFVPFRYFDRRLTVAAGLLFAAYLGLDDLVAGHPLRSARWRFVLPGA